MEPNTNFSITPHFVRYNKNLPDFCKIIYGEINLLCNKEGYCWASNEYFSNVFNKHETNITKAITKLKKENLIKLEYKYNKAAKTTQRIIRMNTYQFSENTNPLLIKSESISENANRVVSENANYNSNIINNNIKESNNNVSDINLTIKSSTINDLDYSSIVSENYLNNGIPSETKVSSVINQKESFNNSSFILPSEDKSSSVSNELSNQSISSINENNNIADESINESLLTNKLFNKEFAGFSLHKKITSLIHRNLQFLIDNGVTEDDLKLIYSKLKLLDKPKKDKTAAQKEKEEDAELLKRIPDDVFECVDMIYSEKMQGRKVALHPEVRNAQVLYLWKELYKRELSCRTLYNLLNDRIKDKKTEEKYLLQIRSPHTLFKPQPNGEPLKIFKLSMKYDIEFKKENAERRNVLKSL